MEVLLLVHLARADLHKKVEPSFMESMKHIIIQHSSYHQAYFLQLNLEVDLLGHQRGPDSTLEANHLAREDLSQSVCYNTPNSFPLSTAREDLRRLAKP